LLEHVQIGAEKNKNIFFQNLQKISSFMPLPQPLHEIIAN